MKKSVLTIVMTISVFAIQINAQVGINTSSPTATIDILAKNATGATTNVDGMLVPRVDRQRAQVMTGVPTSTLIYVNDAATGLQTGAAANIDAVGYYYYNGTAWVKMHNPSNAIFSNLNIYNSNGALDGNRIVTQAANTLAFTASATNAFSVDGAIFSIDAANDRLGIGTAAPVAKVDIVGTLFGMKSSTASGSWDNIWFNVTPSIPSINVSGAESGLQFNVGANSVGTYGDGQTLTTVATMLSTGNMGVGTTTPATKFHVEGAEVRLSNATSLWGLDPEGTSPTSQFSIIDRTNSVRRLILTEGGNAFLGGALGTSGANATISAVGGSVGIGNNTAPTNTLDVNGTTRVRTVNQAAGSTVISPVYVDPTGVLVKGSTSSTYGGFRSNTSAIASGASGSIITGLADGAYRVTVVVINGCADIATTEFLVHSAGTNNFYALNGQNGLVSSNASRPIFTQTVRNAVGVSWSGVSGCADTSSPAGFDYTITLPSAGTINITNNGNVAKSYRISLTRLD